jgi:uncharacterized protein (DUF1778 family)
MATKSEFLQIRVSPREKAVIKRMARSAGMDISTYALTRMIPRSREQFMSGLRQLKLSGGDSYGLAALNDLLSSLGVSELEETVAEADLRDLAPFTANYVAAMVEQAVHVKRAAVPDWTATVRPLDEPWFASTLPGLRTHLLAASPVPFRRRNLFVDSTLGDRV